MEVPVLGQGLNGGEVQSIIRLPGSASDWEVALITLIICPNLNGFHEALYLQWLIADGVPPLYNPTFEKWLELRERRDADKLRAYFLTCPLCISKGVKLSLKETAVEEKG